VSERPPVAPESRPLLGHTLSVLRAPLASIQQWGQHPSPVLRLQVAGRRLCLVTTPQAAKQVLATDNDDYRKASIVRDRLGTLQGNSLVLLEGTEWRERRETLQPAFRRSAVTAAATVTTADTRKMVTEWPTGTPIQLANEVRTLVLGILGELLFGLDLRGEDTPIHEAAEDILARMDVQSVSAYLPEWVPTPTNRRFQRAVSTLHDRIEAQLAGEQTDTSLLTVMQQASLSTEDMRDELIALLFAGYDSTATALTCALGALGAHPSIQADLRTELEAVLGDQPPTPEDLSELSLLDAVVKETLRLYPPQYVLFREPTGPVTIQGYQVPPGRTVVIPPWALHRNPTFWESPATFDPERWLSESEATRPEFAYIPYGGGPRHCLGRGLADQTLRLALATICQHRQLQTQGSLSVSAGPTLAVDPLEVRTFRDTLD
jgi:cytochrome P450